MTAVKSFPAAAAAVVMAAAAGCALPSQSLRETVVKSAVPAYVVSGDRVQKSFEAYRRSLERFHESLTAAVQTAAPDLLSQLEPPQPVRHGYGILPRIVRDMPPPTGTQHARSTVYSWPRTSRMIDREWEDLARAADELERAAALPPVEWRPHYERLAAGYLARRARQENIDAHIKHNRFWQAAIAADPARYGRESKLHDAVLERPAARDSLEPARTIRDTAQRQPASDFYRVEHPRARLWIFRVLFYTDIEDSGFVASLKEAVERIWRHHDGEDEFRVELAISFVPAGTLYRQAPAPATGENIAVGRHLLRFPPDAAVLTTGALATHVYGRAIVLGPHDVAPRGLAHELGHILGFRDRYFRGYRNLGAEGYEVVEIVAEEEDIMAAPASGKVMRRHFETMMERTGVPEQLEP